MVKHLILMACVSALCACDIALIEEQAPPLIADNVCEHNTTDLVYSFNSRTITFDYFTQETTFLDINTLETITLSDEMRGQFTCRKGPFE